jgi:hypothetical protein
VMIAHGMQTCVGVLAWMHGCMDAWMHGCMEGVLPRSVSGG